MVQLPDKQAPQGIIPNAELSTSVVYRPREPERSALLAFSQSRGVHFQAELFSNEPHQLSVLSKKSDEICMRGNKARRCHVTVLDPDLAEFHALQSCPPLEVVAVDEDGWPVLMRAPDPQA